MNEERFYSFLGIVQKSGNLTSGYNNCITEIKKDKCKLVIISEDATENTKKKFEDICKARRLSYIVYGEMERYGRSIGKSPKSILIVKDVNMSKALLDLFGGV